MRRMDRYQKEEKTRISRQEKNQELYQNVSTHSVYANITDVTNANAYEINKESNTTHTTREAYHQMQKYQNIEPINHNKKELDDFNHLYKKNENKVYDINSVLEQARKNRNDKDEKEEKRKLKNQAYNILSGVNKEELEKYREEKKKRLLTPEEEEIRELIDTIASKTLAGEIDKATSVDLLSDLMATNMLDKVEKIEDIVPKEEPVVVEVEEVEEEPTNKTNTLSLSDQVLNTEQIKEIKEKGQEEMITELKEKDPDFYTKSMDLSDKDFEMSDDFKEKKLPLPVIILIILLISIVLGVATYFIYQKFL